MIHASTYQNPLSKGACAEGTHPRVRIGAWFFLGSEDSASQRNYVALQNTGAERTAPTCRASESNYWCVVTFPVGKKLPAGQSRVHFGTALNEESRKVQSNPTTP